MYVSLCACQKCESGLPRNGEYHLFPFSSLIHNDVTIRRWYHCRYRGLSIHCGFLAHNTHTRRDLAFIMTAMVVAAVAVGYGRASRLESGTEMARIGRLTGVVDER